APVAGRIAPLGAPRAGAVLLSWGLGPVEGGKRAALADGAVYDPAQHRWSPAAAVPAPPKGTWCLDAPGCVGVDTGARVVFAGRGRCGRAASSSSGAARATRPTGPSSTTVRR